MQNDDEEHGEYNIQAAAGFLAGILLGALAGAGAMLLMAPQSGKRTRAQIRHKGLVLRDQASVSIDQALTDVRVQGQHITARAHQQADKLQQRGQDMLDQQKERWSSVVEAGKNAVQNTA